MGSRRPPPPPAMPDPANTVRAQDQANYNKALTEAHLNRNNQYTPFGNLIWSQTGTRTVGGREVPTYESRYQLDPNYQTLLDNEVAARTKKAQVAKDTVGQLSSYLGTPLKSGDPFNFYKSTAQDLSGIKGPKDTLAGLTAQGPNPLAGVGITDVGDVDVNESRKRYEDAIFERLEGRLGRDEESLRNRLLNQGLREGSAAYNDALGTFGQHRNDARTSAILAGGQEASRLMAEARANADQRNRAQAQRFGQTTTDMTRDFGQRFALADARYNQGLGRADFALRKAGMTSDMANRDFNNRYKATAGNEAARAQRVNELMSLGGLQTVNPPNFLPNSPVNVPATNVAGIYGQHGSNLANMYGQQLNYAGQRNSGLFGLLGAILPGMGLFGGGGG